MEKMEIILEHWEKLTTSYLPKILLALVIILVFAFIAKRVKQYSIKFYSRLFKAKSQFVDLIASSIYFLILFFGVFLALELLGLDKVLSKMITSAGIVSVVAGFAFKEMASNFLAGFLINIQKPFKIGDWVDINGQYGKIAEIGSITTSIKTPNGQNVYIPNHIIYQNIFTNFSTYNKRRVVMETGVSYGDDLEHVREVTLDEVKKIKVLLDKEDIDFYYTGIGNSAYNFEVRFWIDFKEQTDYLQAMSELIIRIKKRFEKESISVAYSITTLDFGVKGGTNIFDHEIKVKTN